MPDYFDSAVTASKVDRPDEASPEFPGVGGTGVSRSTLDGRVAGPVKQTTQKGVIMTTNEGVTTDESLKSRE